LPSVLFCISASRDRGLCCTNRILSTAGAYDFGYLDNTSYTGSLTYTSADNSSGYWGVTATSYTIGSGRQNQTLLKGIVDTGTTLLYLPRDTVVDYYSNIQGSKNSSTQGGFVFPCDATIPSFTLGIEFNSFTVPSAYLNYEAVGDGTCFGGIQDDSGIGFSIFGDVALKSMYVVFDTRGPQLGFAEKNVG
jgi:aspergillopepsin I